jgi:hypothetical protein
MERTFKKLIVFPIIALAVGIPLVIFQIQPPALVVTEHSFIALYGESRIRTELALSSLVLFRPVKPVVIADDIGADIIQFAISGVSTRPFCVIFPLRFTQAARVYREQNPEIPVVILEGRYPENANPATFAIARDSVDDYFIYKTDITADFYLAGLAAAALDREKNGRIVVFLEANLHTPARDALFRALNDAGKPLQTSFFTSFSQHMELSDLSCVILSGIGSEYLEKHSETPVIFLTWIDPEYIPADVVMVLNDSPFAQTANAVRMVSAGLTRGQIRSKRVVLPGKDIDRDTLRKIKKIVKKYP